MYLTDAEKAKNKANRYIAQKENDFDEVYYVPWDTVKDTHESNLRFNTFEDCDKYCDKLNNK